MLQRVSTDKGMDDISQTAREKKSPEESGDCTLKVTPMKN
jgi:hypothetical protein